MSDNTPVVTEPVAEEAKPTTNEPIEAGDASEAADALLTNVTPTIFTLLSFLAFVLFIVGTPLPWVRSDLGQESLLSLWDLKQTTTAGTTKMKISEHPCAEFKEYFRGAEAFAIITLVVSALTVLMGVVSRIRETSTKPLGTIFAFLTFTASLVTWSIVVSAYNKSFCGQPTLNDNRYYLYAGAGLFVGGWLTTIVCFLVSLKDIKVPKAVPEAAANKLVAVVFTIAAAVAVIFSMVSCIVSLFSKWSTASVQKRISLWYSGTYNNNELIQETKLSEVKCGDFDRYARLAQGFHLMTVIATVIALVAGILAVRGIAGTKSIILSGLFATTTAVVATGADLAMFYKVFCSNHASFDAQKYHRDGAVGLIVTTMVIMAVVTLIAVAIALLQLCGAKTEGGNVSKGAFVYIFGTILATIFMVVALSTPVLYKDVSVLQYTKVMWWETQTLSGSTFYQETFSCEEVWQRMVGGGSIIIAAIVLSAFGAIFGIVQLSNGTFQKPASVLGFVSALLQLVGFSLAADAWRSTYCNYNFKDAGFDYDIGFALIPAAFCVTVLVSVLNLVLKA